MPDYMTFADVAAATNNGDLVPVVEEVVRATTMWNDAPWKASSDMLRDIGGREHEPPRGTWVTPDEGALPNKGSMEKYTEELGIIEGWSKTLKKMADLSPNEKEMRWREDKRHFKGIGFDLEECLVYGSRLDNPRKFDGIIPRFSKITDIDGVAGDDQLPFITINGGGTSQTGMSSILMVHWDVDEGVHLLFPKYKKDSGMEFIPYPFTAETQPDGTILEIAKSKYSATAGLGIANRRSVVRVANIDQSLTGSDMIAHLSTLEAAIYDAFAAIPKDFQSGVKLYANARVINLLRKGFAGRVSPATYQDAIPKNAIGDVQFDSFIIRRCDSMLTTESKVV